MITPMATTSIPLKDDTPPKADVAQQKPRVVVGSSSRPAMGSTGFGTAMPANGCSTKLLLKSHISTRIKRGASNPSAANRHMAEESSARVVTPVTVLDSHPKPAIKSQAHSSPRFQRARLHQGAPEDVPSGRRDPLAASWIAQVRSSPTGPWRCSPSSGRSPSPGCRDQNLHSAWTDITPSGRTCSRGTPPSDLSPVYRSLKPAPGSAHGRRSGDAARPLASTTRAPSR